VARANLAALETPLDGDPDPIFNVSTGKSTSVNALFAALQSVMETDVRARYAPPRPGDVRHSLLDPQKARERLGWQAATCLAEGLKQTAEHFAAKQR
jgi:UDP-glucose 4-epimerase